MPYDFKSLSSADFEELTRDLLQVELGIRLESFKAGKDGGIDLRYSKDEKKTLIVQCKHYSDFKSLVQTLKKEVIKIKKLNPDRYILVTSASCNPQQKEKIKEILSPYIKSTTDDIFCQSDLNNLINRHPQIEKQNFKLWLTSTNVLQNILHSKVFVQSDAEIDYIKHKIKLYVPNLSFYDAEKILSDEHYCIIAGIPGIGKTTLAEIILVFYINQGYEAVKISNDIEEAFSVYQSESKQIFYYDDFLGQTSFDDRLNKNEDQRILNFIGYIKKSKHKRLILTTREYILNQAKSNYERLARSGFDIKKCTLDLSSYTLLNKAKILFNHLYFSRIPKEHIEELLTERFYLKVIEHPNYSPRIVEWMTDIIQTKNITKEKYVKAFLENLDNPEKIWEHVFENQLSTPSHYLLFCMLLFPYFVPYKQLEDTFANFYEYDAQKYNFEIKPYDFKKALKELEGSFLLIRPYFIEFQNPSIRDYLKQKLKTSLKTAKSLIRSVEKPEHIQVLMSLLSNVAELKNDLSDTIIKITDIYLDNDDEFSKKEKAYGKYSPEEILGILLEFRTCLSEDADRVIEKAFKKIHGRLDSFIVNKSVLIQLFSKLEKNNKLEKYLTKEFFVEVKEYSIGNIEDVDDVETIVGLHKMYPQEFSKEDFEKIANAFEDVSYEHVSDLIADEFKSVQKLNNDLIVLENLSEYLGITPINLDDLENCLLELEEQQTLEEDDDDAQFDLDVSKDFRKEDVDNLFELLRHRDVNDEEQQGQ